MYIRNRIFSITFKFVLVVFAICGILMNLGVFDKQLNLKALIYFTVLSNILCAVYFTGDLIFLIRNFRDEEHTTWNHTFKGITTMNITVTLLVAHFILGMGFSMGSSMGVSLLIVHYIVPIMTIFDWLLFNDKGHIRVFSPFLWTLAPLGYFVFIVTAAQFNDGSGKMIKYPYPFMDIDVLGLQSVLLNVMLLLIFFIALGFLSFAVEKFLIKIGIKKTRSKYLEYEIGEVE